MKHPVSGLSTSEVGLPFLAKWTARSARPSPANSRSARRNEAIPCTICTRSCKYLRKRRASTPGLSFTMPATLASTVVSSSNTRSAGELPCTVATNFVSAHSTINQPVWAFPPFARPAPPLQISKPFRIYGRARLSTALKPGAHLKAVIGLLERRAYSQFLPRRGFRRSPTCAMIRQFRGIYAKSFTRSHGPADRSRR